MEYAILVLGKEAREVKVSYHELISVLRCGRVVLNDKGEVITGCIPKGVHTVFGCREEQLKAIELLDESKAYGGRFMFKSQSELHIA